MMSDHTLGAWGENEYGLPTALEIVSLEFMRG
jgi:hypothetical protein